MSRGQLAARLQRLERTLGVNMCRTCCGEGLVEVLEGPDEPRRTCPECGAPPRLIRIIVHWPADPEHA